MGSRLPCVVVICRLCFFDMLQSQTFDTEGREILIVDIAYFRTGDSMVCGASNVLKIIF